MEYELDLWRLILFMFFTILSWFGKGPTEGFAFLSAIKKLTNLWVYSEWGKAHGDKPKGKIGYHTWRWIEDLPQWLSVFIILPVHYWLFYVGSSFIGWFGYQRAMGKTKHGRWFPAKSPYRFLTRWFPDLAIPHKPKIIDPIVLVIGIWLIMRYYI